MAGEEEEARTEVEVEAAAILRDLKRIVRARDRRMRRRRRRQEKRQLEEAVQVVPSWGRRRPRSVFEDGNKPSFSVAVVGGAARDDAASPDTPLAFPDSVPEEEDDAARKAGAQDEWVQEQRVAVANLSQEKADLVKQIEEYRGRLLTSRSANESLKQLHKVRQREQEHARKKRMLALRPGTTTTMPNPQRPVAALGLDLNVPADDEAETARAMAAQAQLQRYWQVQVQQFHRAAATAEARRRRLEILRGKVASPLVSCKTRRVAG